jgi:hypothetical protein
MIQRLVDHKEPNYRRKHPGLPYFVWDLGSIDKGYETEEKFVFLSAFEKKVDTLLLNILEMSCCLILQTLTKIALESYLPAGTVAPNAGMHLNASKCRPTSSSERQRKCYG